MAKIDELNANPNVHGILVQLPLPGHIDEQAVIEAISPLKDVDGLHPMNLASLSTTSTHNADGGQRKLPWLRLAARSRFRCRARRRVALSYLTAQECQSLERRPS